MAFKIDWYAIANSTPEQREAEQKARYERHIAGLKSLVEVRMAMVESLVANLQMIPEKHQKFVRGLEYKCTTYGTEGLLGEDLAALTEKQVNYLEGLHKTYVERRPI